jgi:MGT family glycosyltransferase
MARIAFMLDHQEGHLIPTFKAARQLAQRGHSVVYLGLHDSAELVRRQGFEFLPILSGPFPPGSLVRLRDELGRDAAGTRLDSDPAVPRAALYDHYLGEMAQGRDLDPAVAAARPDLFVLNSLMGLNALVVHFRYRLPIVLLSPLLQRSPKAKRAAALTATLMLLRRSLRPMLELVKAREPGLRRIHDVTGRFASFRELVQCPAALTLPGLDHGPEEEVFHVEASVGQVDDGAVDDFPWERLDPSRPIVYCSLGSQSHLAGLTRVRRFLHAVAEGARRRPGWQLVCSTGRHVAPEELAGVLPADAVARRWTPQVPLLRRAAVMITHGGLGSVKECIVNGVPMVVFPFSSDQPDNAARVVHHRLGLSGDLGTAGADEIWGHVESVHADPVLRQGVQHMRREFLAVEDAQLTVCRVEEVLARGRQPASSAA